MVFGARMIWPLELETLFFFSLFSSLLLFSGATNPNFRTRRRYAACAAGCETIAPQQPQLRRLFHSMLAGGI